ncbi:MAG: hypothetical protein MJK15_05155 [Colwellia sp.]|nr:hypothetical protein [Colwellia sp.]
MKLSKFISKVESAGWEATGDAQHKGIELLWAELYPHSAELEAEIDDILLLQFGKGHG